MIRRKAITFIILALVLINLSGLLNHLYGQTTNPIIVYLCMAPGFLGTLIGWVTTSAYLSLNKPSKDLSDWLRHPMAYKLYGLPWLLFSYWLIFFIWGKS